MGFEYDVAGGIVCTAVKSGRDISVTDGSDAWVNPNGTDGPTAPAISNIVFCVIEHDTDTGVDTDVDADSDADSDADGDTDTDRDTEIVTDGDAYSSGSYGVLDTDAPII